MARKKKKRGGRSGSSGQGAGRAGAKPTRAEKVAAQQAAAMPSPVEDGTDAGAGAADALVAPGSGRLADMLAWGGFGLVALVFLVLKSFSFHWQVGDENIYLYMAWAVGDHGALPYRDFFFAHPPLHLLPGVPLFAALGIGPVTARLLPVGASLASALFLFLMARRQLGRVAAVIAVFGFLCSFSLLRASSHWTGINLAVMWLTLGLYFLTGRRPLAAGVAFALGVCTGNYVLPGAVMAGLLAFLDRRRSGLRFLIGFTAPWAAIQILGLIIGGGAYLDGVYRYHFLKTTRAGVSRQMFYRVATDNFLLHLGAILAPLVAWWDRLLARGSGLALPAEPAAGPAGHPFWQVPWYWFRRVLIEDTQRGLARIGALWALGYLLFIFTLPRVFPFYFLLSFPALALALGFSGSRLIDHGLGLLGRLRQRTAGFGRAALIWAGLVVFVSIAFLLRVPIQRGLLPRYVRSRPVPMVWSDSPLPVNELLRSCCFDDVAEAGREYGTVQELLYHESRYFQVADDLAAWIEAHSRPAQVIFGDASSAGLLALLSGRRLADDFADTNTQRFASGVSDPQEVIRSLQEKDLAFVVVGARRGRRPGQWRYGKFASLAPFGRWLREDFEVARAVRDRTKGTYLLLRPKGVREP